MKTDKQQAAALDERVWAAMRTGNGELAMQICRELNRQHPSFAPGWHTASHLALKLNQAPAALQAIDKALELEPRRVAWRLQQAVCLGRLGQIERVRQVVDDLRGARLETAYQCSALGLLLTQLERRDQAVDYYRQAAELEPRQSRHYYNMACLQRSLGRIEAAEENFDRTLELEPTDYEAWKIRSELRTVTQDDNHVAAIEELLVAGVDDPRGRVHLCYALAKELEDLSEWDRSFRYLKQGADLRRAGMRYDVGRDLETMQCIADTYHRGVFDSGVEGSDNSEPVFIIGLPRTGTTLVERILAAHSDVYAAGELNHFTTQMMQQVLSRFGREKRSREDLVRLSSELDFPALGEAYVQSTRPFTGHTRRFIDKLPLNFLYAGLIHLALPRARIINVQRHPLDTCYAIYKQLFVDAYPYSYDLAELGRYYAAYAELMKHWNAVMPGVIHTVQYEELVADVETQARLLVGACGLDWQPECLEYHASKEASTTASTVQVRKPVYRSSVDKWRRYERGLQPLISALQDAGVELPGL